ncbi:MAG: sulfite exporter TauE/SafE family protein [Oligosphaeraceae bacterium]|nr:sulfite exporter TauE/SafE family protein [Oligosphaeraceae bacterium]
MHEYILAAATAVWLGVLCSISPCPLAANIAAISFVSRKVGKVGLVLTSGLLYTLGRVLAYAALGIILVSGLTAAPELSHSLQKYMNLLMGPLLILVAMVLLGLLQVNFFSGGHAGAKLQQRVEKMGVWGSFLLGVIFALSFCPTSAALFFGSLLPLAIKVNSRVALPALFGLATGLPVLLFAFLLAFSANQVGRTYHLLARFELWAQRITGSIFLLLGLWMTLTITIGIKIW